MNLLAYRTYPTAAETLTFDVGHDEKLIDLLNKEIQFYFSLNVYGTGIVDVPLETLEKAILMKEELDLDEDTVNHIELDIAAAQSFSSESVTYECF